MRGRIATVSAAIALCLAGPAQAQRYSGPPVLSEAAVRKASPEELYKRGSTLSGIQPLQFERLLTASAQQGYAPAAADLARAYLYGFGTDLDGDKALMWSKKALELGSPAAFLLLGSIYESGRGAPKDVQVAIGWFRKGVAAHDEASRRRLTLLFRDHPEYATQPEDKALLPPPPGTGPAMVVFPMPPSKSACQSSDKIKPETVIKACSQEIESARPPREFSLYADRGLAYLKTGDFKAAAADFETYSDLVSNLAAYFTTSKRNVPLGDPKKALPFLDQLIVDEPGNFSHRLTAARLRLEQDQVTAAARDLAAAYKINSYVGDPDLNLTYFYLEKGDADAALKSVERSVRLHPADYKGWALRARLTEKKGDAGRALNDLGEAIRRFPGELSLYTLRGEILCRNGQVDLALSDFNKALEINPKAVLPGLWRQWALEAQKRASSQDRLLG